MDNAKVRTEICSPAVEVDENKAEILSLIQQIKEKVTDNAKIRTPPVEDDEVTIIAKIRSIIHERNKPEVYANP